MRSLRILYIFIFVIIGVNAFAIPDVSSIVKRKGGGGHGSSSSGGHGSSSSGSHGSSSSSSSSGSKGGSSRSSSSSSSIRPTYSGGRYYAGGGTTAYAAGLRSPGGLLPLGLLSVTAVSVFFPGPWLYPVYYYPYSHPYTYYNETANQNQTTPILCLCQEYTACGCDDNGNSTFIEEVIGDGDPNTFNQSLVRMADVNGTNTVVLNGTLPNGTVITSGAVRNAGMGATWLAGWLAISAVTFFML